jgi:hypothetical protein
MACARRKEPRCGFRIRYSQANQWTSGWPWRSNRTNQPPRSRWPQTTNTRLPRGRSGAHMTHAVTLIAQVAVCRCDPAVTANEPAPRATHLDRPRPTTSSQPSTRWYRTINTSPPHICRTRPKESLGVSPSATRNLLPQPPIDRKSSSRHSRTRFDLGTVSLSTMIYAQPPCAIWCAGCWCRAARWASGDLEARREAMASSSGTFRSARPACQIRCRWAILPLISFFCFCTIQMLFRRKLVRICVI